MTTKRMKRKYEKPAMQVFELKQQPQILAGSSPDGNKPDYVPEGW